MTEALDWMLFSRSEGPNRALPSLKSPMGHDGCDAASHVSMRFVCLFVTSTFVKVGSAMTKVLALLSEQFVFAEAHSVVVRGPRRKPASSRKLSFL